MLFNLLGNAVTYSEEGTKITVRARRMDDQVELSVSDQGPGIREEDAVKIFDKFYLGSRKESVVKVSAWVWLFARPLS